MFGFWIFARARGITRLEFRAWLRELDAEDRRLQAEAPAGWEETRRADHQWTAALERRA